MKLEPLSLDHNNKLLIISGPTATGKTDLAVRIAKKFNGELISADSRQIYKGLDIGVGKDHPVGTPIHLIDILTPDKIFSAAEFKAAVNKVITQLHSQNKLPILVGCSGYYINTITNPDYSTFHVKPNTVLRFFLNFLPVFILQKILYLLDKKTYINLNNSDLHNPRRLTRKIEILLSKKIINPSLSREGVGGGLNIFHLSLTAPNKFIFDHIDKRVEERLKLGHIDELKNLLKKYKWTDPGLKVSAYQVFRSFFENKISFQKSLDLWRYAEHRDARHQKTWFKKYAKAMFVDVSKPNYRTLAISHFSKWYNKL